ncbi:methylglyoxal synthase [Pseudoalteromonas luteoviolacea]|uniref:Methylglyoxal synthase n=1 Tax=Pseudoalteromonas luteoviolacea TaxID=43657 RepID=A0A1C0TNX2_9GAMM|nr:methylglyoxal synthase [Pseudoalteromonas luteoviolacea]MBQ4813059.1 methylglyoxal synthase [Pseudoalteromonas luteoviolacea]OCQ20418.1 methylglyoxal synthase [Pseudoalteromonas luteoviolacea]
MEHKLSMIPAQKHIALVAHDGKKQAMVDWCANHVNILSGHSLSATGTTGNLIEAKTGLEITKLLSGPMGGDQQLGAKIAEQRVDMLIFFWDPLSSQPHDPDVKALLRLAAVWNIPVACNEATADMLMTSTFMDSELPRQQPDYKAYLQNRLS